MSTQLIADVLPSIAKLLIVFPNVAPNKHAYRDGPPEPDPSAAELNDVILCPLPSKSPLNALSRAVPIGSQLPQPARSMSLIRI